MSADAASLSGAQPSRWTSDAMTKRTRRRYAAERRFRALGFASIAISVLFLAFLLWNMGSKGLGGFTHYEARVPIDFARSDVMLDPATVRGPDAQQVVAGADLSTVIVPASTAAYGGPSSGSRSEASSTSPPRAKVMPQRPDSRTRSSKSRCCAGRSTATS